MNRAVGAERAMKVVIAPDSFKEAMTAVEAAAAMARGVLAVVPDAEVVDVPMSDGGEGFTEAVAATLGARVRAVGTVTRWGVPSRAVWRSATAPPCSRWPRPRGSSSFPRASATFSAPTPGVSAG